MSNLSLKPERPQVNLWVHRWGNEQFYGESHCDDILQSISIKYGTFLESFDNLTFEDTDFR